VRIGDRIREWPVEEWAASAARVFRRLRRKVARRPGRVIAAVVAFTMAGAVASNALWRQEAPHPAPLWGKDEGDEAMAVAAHGGPGGTGSQAADDSGSSLVVSIQEELAANGYHDGPVTGVLDEPTRAAIRAFERAQGLAETGEPSVGLLAAVTSGVRAVPTPAERGPSDLDVADIQRLLNEHGFGPLTVDGVMGPKTRSALRRFAEARGLPAADVRSPAVLGALAGGDR